MKKASLHLLTGLAVFSLVNPSQAHAYLDPGTGSIIAQAVLAGVAGIATVTKLYWNKIRQFLPRSRRSSTPD